MSEPRRGNPMRLVNAICDALGIDAAQVRRVRLEHTVFSVPWVEVERYVVVDFDEDLFKTELKRYELHEVGALADPVEERCIPRPHACPSPPCPHEGETSHVAAWPEEA